MIFAQAKKLIHNLDVNFSPNWDPEVEQEAAKGEKGFKGHLQLDRDLVKKGLQITVTNKNKKSLTVEIKRNVKRIDEYLDDVWDTISIKDKDKVLSSYDFYSLSLYDTKIKYSDVLKEFIKDVRKKAPKEQGVLYQIALGEVCKSVIERENQLENIHRKAEKEKGPSEVSKLLNRLLNHKSNSK